MLIAKPPQPAMDLLIFGARTLVRVPLALVRLPAAGVGRALHASKVARQGYADLAQRGFDVFSQLRGDASGGDASGAVAPDEAFADAAHSAAGPAPELHLQPDQRSADIVTRAAKAAEAASTGAVSPGASPAAAASAAVERTELPIPDFDHVTSGSLRGRLRRLGLDDLRTLRGYEQQHAARLPILTMLENRIAKLEADGAA